MIVIDASAMVELLMLTPAGHKIGERIFQTSVPVNAPELLDVEVAQTIRRFELLRDLTPGRAHQMLQDLADFRLNRYSHAPLMTRIWELRKNLTAYDAAYVALAEGLDGVLLTRDRALAKAPHRARVEVV